MRRGNQKNKARAARTSLQHASLTMQVTPVSSSTSLFLTPEEIKNLLQTTAIDVTSVDAVEACLDAVRKQNNLSQQEVAQFLGNNFEDMVQTFAAAQFASDELKLISSELRDIHSKIDAPNV